MQLEAADTIIKAAYFPVPRSKWRKLLQPYSSLRSAILQGDTAEVRAKLLSLSSPDHMNVSENPHCNITPLFSALMKEDCPIDIIKALLDNNASTDPRELCSSYPFFVSPVQICSRLEFISLLINHGVTCYCPFICFIEAVSSKHDSIALHWIEIMQNNFQLYSTKIAKFFGDRVNCSDFLEEISPIVFHHFYNLIKGYHEDALIYHILPLRRFDLIKYIYTELHRDINDKIQYGNDKLSLLELVCNRVCYPINVTNISIYEQIADNGKDELLENLIKFILDKKCIVTANALFNTLKLHQSVDTIFNELLNHTNNDINPISDSPKEFFYLAMEKLSTNTLLKVIELEPKTILSDFFDCFSIALRKHPLKMVKKLVDLGLPLSNLGSSTYAKLKEDGRQDSIEDVIKYLTSLGYKQPLLMLKSCPTIEMYDFLSENNMDMQEIVQDLPYFLNYLPLLSRIIPTIDNIERRFFDQGSLIHYLFTNQLKWRSMDNYCDAAKVLLENGWNCNVKCCESLSPLAHALEDNRAELFQLFLDYNADPTYCELERMYPHQYDKSSWKDIRQILAARFDNPQKRDTPFHKLFTRCLSSPRKRIMFQLLKQLPHEQLQLEVNNQNAFEYSLDHLPRSGNKSYLFARELLGEVLIKMNIDVTYAQEKLEKLKSDHPNTSLIEELQKVIEGLHLQKRRGKSARFIVDNLPPTKIQRVN